MADTYPRIIRRREISAVTPSKTAGNLLSSVDPDTVFQQTISDHLHVVQKLSLQLEVLKSIATAMIDTILVGGRVVWCGNGGSAADCQHLAAEFVGRFRRERRGLASIALTTDTSVLTAIGNDYGFNEIFRRQVQAICCSRDMVIGISTSGHSRNVLAALDEAKEIGASTACFTGIDGGEIGKVSDLVLTVDSKDTARIQETHILAGHLLCDWVELTICLNDSQLNGEECLIP